MKFTCHKEDRPYRYDKTEDVCEVTVGGMYDADDCNHLIGVGFGIKLNSETMGITPMYLMNPDCAIKIGFDIAFHGIKGFMKDILHIKD